MDTIQKRLQGRLARTSRGFRESIEGRGIGRGSGFSREDGGLLVGGDNGAEARRRDDGNGNGRDNGSLGEGGRLRGVGCGLDRGGILDPLFADAQ